MENENKNNEMEKKETWFQEKKRKAKKWIGRHMWIKDTIIFGTGTAVGLLAFSIKCAVEEVIKEASSPEVEVPGGTITFEE